MAITSTGFTQFSASWHEANVQHVRCAEHGELTHVATAQATESAPAHHKAIESSDPVAPAGHEHCAFIFAVEGGAQAPVVRVATKLAPPPVIAPQPAEPAPLPGRVVVLASAPKTSPPSA